MRKFEFNRIRRTFFFDNLNNLRDYVTGALDYNRIANADVFAPDFVFIMQRGVRNDDTADIYRFQVGYRCQGTGPPDLDADVVDSGDGLFGREFVGDCPTRRPSQKAQAFLQGNGVNLVNHAVNVIRKRSAQFHNAGKALFDFVKRFAEAV